MGGEGRGNSVRLACPIVAPSSLNIEVVSPPRSRLAVDRALSKAVGKLRRLIYEVAALIAAGQSRVRGEGKALTLSCDAAPGLEVLAAR